MGRKLTEEAVRGAVGRGLSDREAAGELGVGREAFWAARRRLGLAPGRPRGALSPYARAKVLLTGIRGSSGHLRRSVAVRRDIRGELARAYGLPDSLPRLSVRVVLWLSVLGPKTAGELAELLEARQPYGYRSFTYPKVTGGNHLTMLIKEGLVWRTKRGSTGRYAVTELAAALLAAGPQ